jgi:hypothetical protein
MPVTWPILFWNFLANNCFFFSSEIFIHFIWKFLVVWSRSPTNILLRMFQFHRK